MIEFIPGQPGFMGAPEYFRGGVQIDPNALSKKYSAQLRIGFQNASFAHVVPARSTQVQIDLGPNLEPVELQGSSLDEYFDYEVTENNDAFQIVATQKEVDIPAGFYGMFEFEVQPKNSGTSSVIANLFLVNLGEVGCSDPIDGDNSTNAEYTVI